MGREFITSYVLEQENKTAEEFPIFFDRSEISKAIF